MEANILDCAIRAYKDYWELLGSMRGIANITGKICRLEGDISYTYLATFDETGVERDLADLIEKINSKEIENEFRVIPQLYSGDIVGKILANHDFRESNVNFGMVKELSTEAYEKHEDKNLNIFRVNDVERLKFCGSILNACFDYDIFSFSHYLDAYNCCKIKFYIAEYKGLPAGACMAMHGEDYVEIVWVGTLPGYRKKGIAGRIISRAEADAVNAGKRFATLVAVPDAKPTYERLNYKQCYTMLGLVYQPEKN